MTDEPSEPVPETGVPVPAQIIEGPRPVPAIVQQRDAAVTAAADAALAMPGLPGKDEFLTLAMSAKMLSLSGAAPKPVRESPYVAFHVAMVGRDLGISPSAAIELIDVMKGKDGSYQLSLSPQLLNGQIRRLGLGSIMPRERTNERCVAVAYGPDGRELGESEFTWEDARMAGLVGEKCNPGEHHMVTKSGQNGSYQTCGCNQGYKTYPKRMLWWRASGFAADDFFPEAGLGLYTAEELGALVDEHGRAIDPMTVELPEGYETPALNQQGATSEPEVDPHDLVVLWARIKSLPIEEREDLRARWKQLEKLGQRPPHVLNETAYRLADSIVRGMETKAKSREKYNAAEATAETLQGLYEHVTMLLTPFAQPPSAGREPADAPVPAEGGPAPSDEQVADAAGEEVVDEEIEAVTSMGLREVRKALKDRDLDETGEDHIVRRRLVMALLRTRVNVIEGMN